MTHLKSVSLKPTSRNQTGFPFNLPLFNTFDAIEFRSPVTFFVGENGSGKSTLLESIAAASGSIVVGGEDLSSDATLKHARRLGKHLRLSWQKRISKGFFLRAEDFFNFAKRLSQMRAELESLSEEYEEKFSGYALSLAKGSVEGQRAALIKKYGEDLDANSHGESFLKLFQARFVPGGLYLLDEPEAPLSPLRQLAFLSLLKEMVEEQAQFIIATHSPIIMAFPGASILSFDKYPISEVSYDEVEHVTLTKSFLNNPERFLRQL
jgi:predicted ATPase